MKEKKLYPAILTGMKAEEDQLFRFQKSGTRYLVQKETGSVINPDRKKFTKSQKRQLKRQRTAERVATQQNLNECKATASTK